MLAALMQIESGGKAGAISKAGAVGLMQVMPREAGPEFAGRPPTKELLDPWLNIMMGASIFAQNLQAWGSPPRAAAGYFGAISPTGQITGAKDVGGVSGFDFVRQFIEAYAAFRGTGGQEPMTVQGMSEVQRVLSSTKTTQDSYLATTVQQLISANQTLRSMYTMLGTINRGINALKVAAPQTTPAQVTTKRTSGYGAGGAIVGNKQVQP